VLKNKRSSLAFLSSFTLLFSSLASSPALAIEQRTIDVAFVTWSGAGALPGNINEVRNEIDNDVKSRWKDLTSIYGNPVDKRIEFVFGLGLTNPIVASTPLPCEKVVTAWTDVIRDETYKRLGILNNQSRYLVIITPANGCVWSGLANIGNVNQSGGTLVLHNTTKGFCDNSRAWTSSGPWTL